MSSEETTTTAYTFHVPSNLDAELSQLAILVQVLDSLLPVERGRALRYLTARFPEADRG